ncbi:lipid asymmetry maintenance protein MlaB [Pseudomonadota bacterium]
MTNEREISDSEMIVECNEGLDISMVTDFKAMLRQAAAQDLPVVLDVSNMERVDGAALQLFAAFCLEAQESGLSVSWRSPPEPLCYAAEITGLKSVLNL